MASTSTLATSSNSDGSAGGSTKMPNKRDYAEYLPLHRAIMKSDWDEAQRIISKDKDALTAELAPGRSALHVAIAFQVGTRKSNDFVKNLLNVMGSESLPTLLTRPTRLNPLHRAAIVGNVEAAKMLVDRKPDLLFIPDNKGFLPIHRALFNAQRNTYLYLLDASKTNILLSTKDGYLSPFQGKTGAKLLTNTITSGYIDVAYELAKDYPHIARIEDDRSLAPLEAIARKWDVYYSARDYNFYQRFVYRYVPLKRNLGYTKKKQDVENQEAYDDKFAAKCIRNSLYSVIHKIYVTVWDVVLLRVTHIKRLQEEKVNHKTALMLLKCVCEEVSKLNTLSEIQGHYLSAAILAVKNDTHEAIEEITAYFPRAFTVTSDDYNLSQLAILHRSAKVFNFLVNGVSHNVYESRCTTDKQDSNLLHLAAKLPPIHKLSIISGAALQMQRELQWFRAVENFVPLVLREKKDDKKDKSEKNHKNDKETPIMIFRREHEDLRKEGEEWMKTTANSYTITAALIITIVFAAAITVPGGTDGDTGKPIYTLRPSFIIFAVSNAISFFTSTTSLLLFLSILTARYREEDFLYKLPKRLILGLIMLFLSVTSMMVAFSATFYIMFGHGKAWVVIPVAALACLPIASFVTLQLPLLSDLILSTYGHGILRKLDIDR
uniref:uncharacterized protein LOC122582845 n=1 Tax=Erigeron canadensis TaxID=72917 RepID=UPI001CB90195|nr:uncharacterized protein LOC122582845 [Erigeron canadensis]